MQRCMHTLTVLAMVVSVALWSGCDKDKKSGQDTTTDTETDGTVDPDTVDDPLPDTADDPEPDTADDPEPDTSPDTFTDPDMETDPGTDVETDADPVSTVVEPLYPVAGALWNDYVKNDGTSPLAATDTACNGDTDAMTGVDACLHAGEMRVYQATDLSSCTGVTASDSENAFDWICDDSTGSVRVISTGLRAGMYLSDLIDWTASPPQWKEMTVTATDGTVDDTSDASSWWTNTIVEDNDGGGFYTPSEIIVVTSATPGGDYTLGADRIGIVSEPGVTMPGGDSGGAVISAEERYFLWVEAQIDAASDNYGVGMVSGTSNFAVLRGVTVDGCVRTGIHVSSINARLVDITVTNSGWEGLQATGWYGVVRNVNATGNRAGINYQAGQEVLIEDITTGGNSSDGLRTGVSHSIIRNVVAYDNGQHGIDGASDNLMYGIVVQNTGGTTTGDGLLLQSRNVLFDVQVSNATGRGIALDGDNVVVDVSINNTGDIGVVDQPGDIVIATTVVGAQARGMSLAAAVPPSMNVMMNTAVVNCSGGFSTDTDEGQYLFIDVASTDNTDATFTDVNIDNTVSDAVFSGSLVVTTSSTSCASGNDVGVSDGCVPQAPSDATLVQGSVASAFIGAPTPDSTNAHGAGGTEAYDSITDWIEFDRPLRGWGLGIGGLSSDGIRGRCVSSDTCQIVDLNLDHGVTSALLGVVALPGAEDFVVHHFAAGSTMCGQFPGSSWDGSSCVITFLRNAFELIGDGVGNDNGLCESGERCLFTRNIGRYQGHGMLESAGSIGAGGTIENVELFSFDTNGY